MTSTVNDLPDVGRIQGFNVERQQQGDPRDGVLTLQFTDRAGHWHQTKMSVGDALYLLNLLEAWSRDEGLDQLRRPPE